MYLESLMTLIFFFFKKKVVFEILTKSFNFLHMIFWKSHKSIMW